MTLPRPFAKTRRHGFTLAELMIAIGASTLVFGSLLLVMTSLRQSFDATEKYSRAQAAQIRLIDAIGMDLRRAVAIGITTSTSSNPASTANTTARTTTTNQVMGLDQNDFM